MLSTAASRRRRRAGSTGSSTATGAGTARRSTRASTATTRSRGSTWTTTAAGTRRSGTRSEGSDDFAESMTYDMNEDGRWEFWLVDTNQRVGFDVVYFDDNADGYYDRWAPMAASRTMTLAEVLGQGSFGGTIRQSGAMGSSRTWPATRGRRPGRRGTATATAAPTRSTTTPFGAIAELARRSLDRRGPAPAGLRHVVDSLSDGRGSGCGWPPACRSRERSPARSASATPRTADGRRRTAPGSGE